jgi:hypothetical protein
MKDILRRDLPAATLITILLFLVSSCLGKSDSSQTTTPPTQTSSKPEASGQIVLESCLGLSGVQERCTLVTNASACTGAKCSHLVVIFSGGEMGCITGAGYNNALTGYASYGYAAVCINYFDTPVGSGEAPYIDEASRIDLAVKEATTGTWASNFWTGEYLLFQGISHGATAPMILMARTSLASQSHWQGSRFTAACFFDGSYDQVATANLLATGNSGSPCTTPVAYTRGLERYCGAGAMGETCDLTTNAKAQQNTITTAPVNYAIRDFRMFQCGSALNACSGDIIPGAPVEQLCSAINSTQNYSCLFSNLPLDSHLTCHANRYDQCRTWFESISP